ITEGQRLVKAGKDDEAKVLFTEALNRDPTKQQSINASWAEGYVYRGRKSLDAQREDDATRLFNEALKRDLTAVERIKTAWADYYVQSGEGLASRDKNEDAAAAFTKAIQFNQKNSKAYSGRGKTYDKMKDYDSAILDFDEAIQIDPKTSANY